MFYLNKFYLMKIFLLIFAINIIFLTSVFAKQEFIDTTIDNHHVRVIKVVLDGNHYVITSLSNKWESLYTLMKKQGGISAINGAYFCPADYPHCGWKNFTNAPRFYKWVNYSKYWTDFWVNGVLAFDKNDKPFIVMNHIWWDVPKDLQGIQINVDKIKDIYYWIGNFPVLLLSGKDQIFKYEQLLTNKMKAKSPKTFICFTKDRKTIYFGYINKISIYEIPNFIKTHFKCYNAINLDAGGSLGLIYNNQIIRKESRPIMDAFVVIDRKTKEKMDKLRRKYNTLLNKIVKQIKNKFNSNIAKIEKIIIKIQSLKEKFENNFDIYFILDELEQKIRKEFDIKEF